MKWMGSIFIAVTVALLALTHRELGWQLRHFNLPRVQPVTEGLNLPPCPGCNLVLISADTLRADAIDGNPSGATPNLARLAAKSVRLTRAYTNAFYTTPSHMTLFTSLYPNRHHVTGSEIHITGFERTDTGTPALSPSYKTMAEILRGVGYRTHWFGPLSLKHLSLELGFSRGFEKQSPTLFARPGRFIEGQEFEVENYGRELAATGVPFFHFLHSYITHLPYFTAGEDSRLQAMFDRDRLQRLYYKRLQQAPLPMPPVHDADRFDVFLHSLGQFQLRLMEGARERLTEKTEREEQANLLKRGYAVAVEELDRQLGALLDRLEKTERTLVVLVSDHGEEIFEHGRASHSTFYEHTARIPMMIRHPDMSEGKTYDGLVSLVDLLPTLLSTLGYPIPEQSQGRDLNQGPAPFAFGFALGSAFATDGEWKLLRNARGQDEFYHLRLDPQEQDDLVNSWWPPIRRAREHMREARSRWEREQTL